MFPKIITGAIPQISGLSYFPKFITASQKQKLIQIVQGNQWCQKLSRKQQYYGIKYFQTRHIDPVLQKQSSDDFYPLSQFSNIIQRLIQYKIFASQDPPNQCLVNKYVKATKLLVHIENTDSFGQIISGLSIGTTDYLRLQSVQNPYVEYRLKMDDTSLYVLQGQARHKWKHGITRTIFGQKYKSDDFCRISFTFRHVLESRRKVKQLQH